MTGRLSFVRDRFGRPVRFSGRNHVGAVVGMSAHLFAPGVDAADRERALTAWLDGVCA